MGAAPLGSAGLFARARQRVHVTATWPAARGLVLALSGPVTTGGGSVPLTVRPTSGA
ncbi:MAG TPA: hypothetical protein VMH35_18490 [Streptosporangiaceae bacterium]|nr:hypothetical protein [Streptosporangiaceae bacterium]